ncbi:hypothetical protein B0H13DRAFT_2246722 [Mycena leptocephala]|nr:hypothetical protein B0H13DRAFT_2246722 [Mycena leptocephala]
MTLPPIPSSLNNSVCVVKNSEGKGRGVFAARAIPSQTIVESSPVLLLGKEEYETHGRFTILDQYAFNWKNGSMALALGLGSLFNHSNFPNLSYKIDPSNDLIHYTTTRNVDPDEELCIYYGNNLWFDSVEARGEHASSDGHENDDGWGGLANVDVPQIVLPAFFNGPVDDIVPEEDLPFERFKPPPEEETADTIRTENNQSEIISPVQAWAVDVPDARSIGPMLNACLDGYDAANWMQLNSGISNATFLLSLSPDPPILPEDIVLPDPYLVTVPSSVALTTTSLSLKTSLWPTIYAPRRKGEVENAMHVVVQEALRWRDDGEVRCSPPHDTRQSAAHPLRHAVMNVIRQIADHRAASDVVEPIEPDGDSARNGSNYLLTSQILFTTHEPCIMCSMALSIPASKKSCCGGLTCVPTLPGVNHRFSICRWKGGTIQETGLELDPSVDA